MRRATRLTRLLIVLLCLLPSAAAQTTIEFWHSQDATEAAIDELATRFNGAQDEFRVEPRYIGNYQENAIRLIAGLRSGDVPALFDAELTIFMRLVDDRALVELDSYLTDLPVPLIADIPEPMWEYGRVGDRRFGLPWSMSMPVLIYNADVARQLGVEPPTDWDAFEATAARLTTRNSTGYIDVAAAIVFETMVASRGGSLVTPDLEPNFDGPEAIATLEMLQRLARSRHSIPRSFAELDRALVDFARGKGMMSIGSQALIPQGERFAVGFDIGVAPIPSANGRGVPFTGAQLVVPQGTSEAEQRGAVAFWRFLIEPDNVRAWVEASHFLPVRTSAVPLLEAWYAEDPGRRVGLEQLPDAVVRPQTGDYALWQTFLQEAIERVTLGGGDPAEELGAAQRRAESAR